MGQVQIPPLYKGPRCIKEAKLRDLMQLLDYIPPVYHSYHVLAGAEDSDSCEESELECEG